MTEEAAKTLRGTIRAIKQGYGFIRDELTRQDHFFHKSELVKCNFDELEPGAAVEFFGLIEDKPPHQGRRKAHDVVLINPADKG